MKASIVRLVYLQSCHLARLACTTVLIGLLAGCDGRDLTSPAVSAPNARPDLLPAGYPELPVPNQTWSTFFSVPANSSREQIATITPEEFASVPDSTWVVINVNGNVTQAWNSDCATASPNWPCQTGSVVGAFAASPWEGGPVRIWTSAGSVRLRSVGGASANSGIGLHYMAAGGALSGQINAQPRWAWDPTVGNGTFSYFLSGGYDVSAMAVARPLGITSSGPLDTLGTRQYTVQPLYDLRFINPIDFSWNPPAGAIDWYFIPGDAVGLKPDGSGAIAIGACHYQQVCEYAPPGPGRMEVTAYVEAQRAAVRGTLIGRCEVASPELLPDDASVPPECEDKQFAGCPKELWGKYITAGITVGTTLHTFHFDGVMTRISTSRRSPARYTIAHPTTSTDAWWIAESGWIGTRCIGVFIPVEDHEDRWVGKAWYAGENDLHMVMGPGHPNF